MTCNDDDGSDDGADNIWDGTEWAREPPELEDDIDVKDWFFSINYDEVHAVQMGWILMVATFGLWHMSIQLWIVPAVVWTILVGEMLLGYDCKPVGYVAREPHYFWFASLFGVVSATAAYISFLGLSALF